MASQVMFVLVASVLCIGKSLASVDQDNWSYHGAGTGEQYWKDIPGSYCDANSQSPIDIDSTLTARASHSSFNIGSYGIEMDVTIENNGHALVISDLDANGQTRGYYEISGGGLSGTFRAIQFHFHFGSNANQGSEHTVDGKKYPAEMHIVHYDTAYADASAAMKVKGGIAVLGFFLEQGTSHNSNFDVILNKVNEVQQPHTDYPITNFKLANLLPSSTDKYWRYDGSLTTPLCNEVVTWTLFKDAIPITKQQLDIMRTMYSSTEDHDDNYLKMEDNYRSVQSLNGRTVYDIGSDDDDDGFAARMNESPMTRDSASAVTPSVVVTVASLLAGLFYFRV